MVGLQFEVAREGADSTMFALDDVRCGQRLRLAIPVNERPILTLDRPKAANPPTPAINSSEATTGW